MQFIRRPLSTQELQRLVSTRGGMVAVASLVAVLAGTMLLVFLSQYRQRVADSGNTVRVLVARNLIEKGSPGDVIASKGLFETASIKQGERKSGAIADPASLKGEVTANDIYPGEQLTTRDFTGATDSVTNKVSDFERAVSIPLDAAHGMIGDVRTGDHVDVLAGFNVDTGLGRPRPVLRAVMQDVLVLRAPSQAKGGMNASNNTQNVVLRAPDQKAWEFAFSSEYGKVWIVLRPKAGAEETRPSPVTLEKVLFGIKPISVKKLIRGASR
jgi:Flp pilus assembly protein CpaB